MMRGRWILARLLLMKIRKHVEGISLKDRRIATWTVAEEIVISYRSSLDYQYLSFTVHHFRKLIYTLVQIWSPSRIYWRFLTLVFAVNGDSFFITSVEFSTTCSTSISLTSIGSLPDLHTYIYFCYFRKLHGLFIG